MTSRRYYIASLILFVVLLQLFLVLLTRPAQALDPQIRTTFEPYGPENPLPKIVLIEYDPWRMVIGSDSPTFALYENGQVIYTRENEDGDMEYASVFLNREAYKALVDKLVDEEFYTLDDYYETVLWTDQPTNWIIVWDEKGNKKQVGAYGMLHDREGEARAATPDAFLQAFDGMITYDHEDAQRWLPKQFEIMLWPYDVSSGTKWPKDWPDLDDPTTKKRGDDSYSIFVDTSELGTFYTLAENASAVELDGKRWAFSIRFPFPTEFVWME
ncbi:MAG: hypothetical protein K8I82_04650 [Anaerolineae bacterium]|nr:hypothetical protein [Anaerolineae bacterium]